jgi:hypothetical protein
MWHFWRWRPHVHVQYSAVKPANVAAGLKVVIIEESNEHSPLGCVYGEVLGVRSDQGDGLEFRLAVADECKVAVRAVKKHMKIYFSFVVGTTSWWVLNKFRVVEQQPSREDILEATKQIRQFMPVARAPRPSRVTPVSARVAVVTADDEDEGMRAHYGERVVVEAQQLVGQKRKRTQVDRGPVLYR